MREKKVIANPVGYSNINEGKGSYQAYLVESYGRYNARRILDPKSQAKITAFFKKKAFREEGLEETA